MIQCVKCKTLKIANDFPGHKHKKNGLGSWCKECVKICSAVHRKNNLPNILSKQKKYDRLRLYGMTQSDYNQLFAEQLGCCAICGKHQNEFNRGLHIDHDHRTGKVRGLLCHRCNPGIGYLQEDVEILEKAIKYLLRHKN